jgi:hypothetical protein
MPALSEGTYQGDWIIEEFAPPNFCRTEINVLAPVDLNSGAVIGLATTLTSYYVPYDNVGGANLGKSAAAAGILLDSVPARPDMACSIVDSANVGTGTTTEAHCLAVGDIIAVTGGTDADLNVYAAIVSVPTTKTFTIATSNVTDTTYAVRIRKLNQAAVGLLRGPLVVANLDWGSSDATGITDGKAELLALQIVVREGI